MKKRHVILLAIAFTGVFLAGLYTSRYLASSSNGSAGRRILYYVDPMNPAHTSDEPGLAPCGMKLEPVYADEMDESVSGPGRRAQPGSVRISPERQQMIGVKIGEVEETAEEKVLRTVGRVTPDENRVSRLVAGRDGYMGDVRAALPTGTMVKKDQLLASYFAVDSLAAQQSYVFALNSMGQNRQDLTPVQQLAGGTASLLLNAEENLKLFGMGEAQVREIARTRQLSNYIEVRAPFAGLIVTRKVFPYSLFQRDTEFFRIAELSQVWIYADVYENQQDYIKPGTVARVSLPGTGRVFEATVSDGLPLYDPVARTYKVRLDAANPDWALRPDVVVDIDFSVPVLRALTVPVDAVLDTGLNKMVFISLEDGYFEPRAVRTGWRAGGKVQIVEGLTPGERVVVSGNFLISSESRMKLAAAGIHGTPERDPSCGMDVDPEKARAEGLVREWDGKTWYFCSHDCAERFDAEHASPSRAAEKDHSAEGTHAMQGGAGGDGGFAGDPVCGMMVHKGKAEALGLKSEHGNDTFYFCSRDCKSRFDAAPDRWMGKSHGGRDMDGPKSGGHAMTPRPDAARP